MGGPWEGLPRDFSTELRAEQQSLASEIIREIRSAVPEFSRPLSGQFGAGIQQGVETALAEFTDRVAGLPSPGPRQLRVYRSLGRGELSEGRSLDALQAAFRLGARIAWRRYARVARRRGLAAEQLVTLAEAVFAHIDEVAAASVQGYVDARTDRAGALGRARQRLHDLLLAGADPAELAAAARLADWPLPAQVAAVSLDPRPAAAPRPPGPSGPSGPSGPPPARLPDRVLAGLDVPQPHLLLPDPATALADPQLAAALHGRGAVIGPAVPPALAAQSLRWARLVRAALPEPPQRPVDCRERYADLLLLTDPALVRLIAERRLAPLAPLTPKQRERLAATLLAWLQTGRGTAPEVAARLGIHPQTARQRLHRVHRLFGPALASPDTRLELEIALRATAPSPSAPGAAPTPAWTT
ncbi:Fis family transcriptional regulator [Kitasatospora phosalacinea]|uniref:Fis family transcriptional regulator n=1 Tax=Kitasatospora phosalacinea TaxID=2065 RepID=A0A9W6QED4_9ACTN|nr:Fis family transcriptional regulator [Kitasatospora phosalacinea]